MLQLEDFAKCSTPFGITGKLTLMRRKVRRISRGAQRLSASQENSLGGFAQGYQFSLCSTPFGITGKLTRPCLTDHFRHLLCSTPFGITGKLTSANCVGAPRCRRVLNAFRHHRKTHRKPFLDLQALGESAQRLSASQENSLIAGNFHRSQSLCSTPFGITGKLT